MQQVGLGEWLFPVWLVGARFDGVADGAWAGCVADGVCLHAVCVVAVGRIADVLSEDGRHLNQLASFLIGILGRVYLLETFPGERNVGTGHFYKVTFFASVLAIADVLTHLRSVVNVGNIVYESLEATTEVFDVPIGNLEEEEGLYTLGQAIQENVSLDVLEIEGRHIGACDEGREVGTTRIARPKCDVYLSKPFISSVNLQPSLLFDRVQYLRALGLVY